MFVTNKNLSDVALEFHRTALLKSEVFLTNSVFLF